MKNILIVIIFLGVFNAHSQIADGSIAPDFTLEDWYGNSHTLYDYLDEEKTVFLEVFAAHCPPCWAYHQTDRLKNMYNLYGPEGTDEVMVLALEHDIWNGFDAFNGIGDPWTTQGNWLEGTPYPQFNVEEGDRVVFEDYNVTFYPVIYKICPDKTIERVQTSTLEDELYEGVQECSLTTVKEESQSWSVYFNQDTRSVIIDNPEAVKSLRVLNLQGQIVKTLDTISNPSIDVSDLAHGVYVFEFQTESESIIQKLAIN